MHIDEFIDKLAKTANQKKWEFAHNCGRKLIRCEGSVRCEGSASRRYDECPISALRNMKAANAQEAATELGLNASDAVNIICAADDVEGFQELREKLLIATGLKE